jgi:hypothetical protein
MKVAQNEMAAEHYFEEVSLLSDHSSNQQTGTPYNEMGGKICSLMMNKLIRDTYQ